MLSYSAVTGVLLLNMRNLRLTAGAGTPSSLVQAIKNGLADIDTYPDLEPDAVIRAHLKEFLSQKFVFTPCPKMKFLTDPRVVWNRIFPEDLR